MKALTYTLFAAAAACCFASAQTTAYTTPVGYVTLGDTTPGQPSVKARTDVFISVPLLNAAEYAGTVASVSGNEITLSGTPGFTNGQFANPATPYYAVIQSGAKEGQVSVVALNGANTITLMQQPGETLAGVVAGDKVTIRKAWTVRSLMGTSLPAAGISLYTLPASGPYNPSAEGIYDWDGTNWIDSAITGAPADNDVLFPGETLILRNDTATPIASLIVSGEVLASKTRIPLAAAAAPADYAASYFSAVGERIGSSSLATVAVPGDALLGFDNSATGFNKSATVILDFDGTDWIDNAVTGAPFNDFLLGGGQGFIFRRAAAASATVWSDQAAYVPSL